jgi:peptide deformylase
MAVRPILKMGDPRLLRIARSVEAFDTPWLAQLLADMNETMRAANGAGLAAPQIGEDWQIVVFGTDLPNPRYPHAPAVPRTVLINPTVTPLGDEMTADWEGCLSVPGLRGLVPRFEHIRYSGFDARGRAFELDPIGLHGSAVPGPGPQRR